MSSVAPESAAPTKKRGVYRVVVALGIIALQAIDSRGRELVHLRMAESMFDQDYVEWLWDILDQQDPIDDEPAGAVERTTARGHLRLER